MGTSWGVGGSVYHISGGNGMGLTPGLVVACASGWLSEQAGPDICPLPPAREPTAVRSARQAQFSDGPELETSARPRQVRAAVLKFEESLGPEMSREPAGLAQD